MFNSIAGDISSDSYKDLYTALLKLCSSLLCFMEKHHAVEEKILQVVAARSCFQHIWVSLACLPPPLLLMKEMTSPEKVFINLNVCVLLSYVRIVD